MQNIYYSDNPAIIEDNKLQTNYEEEEDLSSSFEYSAPLAPEFSPNKTQRRKSPFRVNDFTISQESLRREMDDPKHREYNEFIQEKNLKNQKWKLCESDDEDGPGINTISNKIL